MGAIEHLTISLPAEVAERMRARVASGEYADESEAIQDALRCWEEGEVHFPDPALDEWVRREVLPALAAYDQDPSRGLSMELVEDRLTQARIRRARAD